MLTVNGRYGHSLLITKYSRLFSKVVKTFFQKGSSKNHLKA